MKFDDLVAVSGLPGIYKMVANRSNGLIVESIIDEKRRFASARKHRFTPLASIAIYTNTDTVELKSVFNTMFEQLATLPLPAHNCSSEEAHSYFAGILPDFDRDRVYISDIKKVVKWFSFLNDRGLVPFEEETPEEQENESENESNTATDQTESKTENDTKTTA